MSTILTISIGVPRLEKLQRAALATKLTKSEICRRAIDEYLASIELTIENEQSERANEPTHVENDGQ